MKLKYMGLFLPKQTDFFELFYKQQKVLAEIAELFIELTQNYGNLEDFAKKAKVLEKEGDDVAHEIIEKLNKSFITPFDREDIYALATEFDDIVDVLENVFKYLHLYKISEKPKALSQFAPLIKDASAQLGIMLKVLGEKKLSKQLSEAKIAIHNIEDRADEFYSQGLSELFSNHTEAVAIIKNKDILESLEKVADKMQRMSDVIENIVVKSS